MSGWEVTWAYAGTVRTYAVDDIEWNESRSLFESTDDYLNIGFRFLPLREQHPARTADRFSPLYTDVTISLDGRSLLRAAVSQCSYGGPEQPIRLTITEDRMEDAGEFPTAAQRSITNVYSTGTVYRERGDKRWTNIYETTTTTIVDEDTYPTAPGRALGTVLPRVWGEPGTLVVPGSPAVVIATSGGNVSKIAISDGRVEAATVMIWGNNNSGELVSIASVPVEHETNSAGLTYAYVAADTPSMWSGSTKPNKSDTEGDWFVGWLYGKARPSGAAAVLAEVLSASSLQVDTASVDALAPYLDAYKIDGYVNDYVKPMDFLTQSLLPMLPVVLYRGTNGITASLWPWVSGEPPRFTLTRGRTCWRAGEVSYADREAMAARTVEYCFSPSTEKYHYTRTADPQNTGTGIAARSRSAGGLSGRSSPLKLPFTWDPQTASRVAMDRLSLTLGRPREVEYECDVREHGLGGRRPLRVGLPVAITDDELGWTERLAVVTEISRTPLSLSVRLLLRDDPLLGTSV